METLATTANVLCMKDVRILIFTIRPNELEIFDLLTTVLELDR